MSDWNALGMQVQLALAAVIAALAVPVLGQSGGGIAGVLPAGAEPELVKEGFVGTEGSCPRWRQLSPKAAIAALAPLPQCGRAPSRGCAEPWLKEHDDLGILFRDTRWIAIAHGPQLSRQPYSSITPC
jgi:hypothetical protein